jgi:hypothetical protein
MIKVNLRKIRINSGGYTDNGEYFGVGLPLYSYEYELEFDFENPMSLTDIKRFRRDYLRATDRKHAKELVRKTLIALDEDIRFYN